MIEMQMILVDTIYPFHKLHNALDKYPTMYIL